MAPDGVDSRYAWMRLGLSMLLMIIGGSGMYTVIVVLPELQREFSVARADAALPYTLTMLGFGVGGVLLGRLADRRGVAIPLMLGGISLGAGFILAGLSGSLWQFSLIQGVLIGMLGSSASFGPLMADTSLWFLRRRGIAVALCASGNYLAGAIWPPVLQTMIEHWGWRNAYIAIGVLCLVTLAPLSLLMRRRAPSAGDGSIVKPEVRAASNAVSNVASNVASTSRSSAAQRAGENPRPLGLPSPVLLGLLSVAGIACCIAMAMPQVHIVAYCTDLGFGAARGAQMLSVMLATGVVSRLVFGLISDRIGGLRTLFLGSALQALALVLFLPFQDMVSLFVVSALFGLFQGGIVPAYAIVIREYFPAQVAASRVGVVLAFTLLGMAAGGWMSGWIFDVTGNYQAAFINGIAWNLFNLLIIGFLLTRRAASAASRN
jgi:MFS family permease